MSFSSIYNYNKDFIASSHAFPTFRHELTGGALSNVYGTTKLIENYTGFAIACRKQSGHLPHIDRSVVNVFFDEQGAISLDSICEDFQGGFESGTLGDFANGQDVGVVVWYDQLGGRHAIEPTGFDPLTINQYLSGTVHVTARTGYQKRSTSFFDYSSGGLSSSPVIIESGNIRMVNNMPSVFFSGDSAGAHSRGSQALFFSSSSDVREPFTTGNIYNTAPDQGEKLNPVGIIGSVDQGMETFAVCGTTPSADDGLSSNAIKDMISGAGPTISPASMYKGNTIVGGSIFNYKLDYQMGFYSGHTSLYSENEEIHHLNRATGNAIRTGEQMILHGCHLVNEFPGQTGHSGLVACVRDGNNIQTQTPGSTGRYQNNKGVVASSGSGNPMRGDVQVCSIGDPGDFNNSATCADIQAVLISTGSLSTSVRNGIKETLNDVYKVFDTGTTNIFTPNYNSSIKFTSDNSAWRGSDFNSFIMANGLNNIKADLNLNFILNTKDSINLLNFIENKTTGIVTGETAFDGRNTVINFGENQNGFQINLDTGYYNNFSGSHITNYNIRKLAHNVNQIDLTLSNNRTSSFLSNGEGFVKKTFYPDHISGLGFWVDASDTGTILLSGNAGSTAPLFTGITGVVDKVRGVTGVCNPSGVVYRSGFINNNSVIYTSGGPGGQDLGIKWKLGQGFNVDRESHEMFALVSMNVDEDENVGFFGDASYRQGGAMFSFFGDTLLYTTNKNGHDTSDGNNTISFSNYPLITGKFFLVNGVLSGNRDVEFNVNGGSFSTGSGALSTNDTLTTFQYPLGQFPRRATSNGFTIFDGPQGGHSNDFIGSFAEGLVYNRALTPNERQLVVEYFTKKWGTELTVFKDDFNNGNTGNQLVDNNTQSFNDFRFLTRGDLAIISSGTQATDTTSYTFPGDGVLRLTFEPSGSESNTGFYSNKVFGLRYGTFEHSAVDGGLDDGANYLFEFEGRVNNGGGSNSGSLHFDINDRYVQSITGTSTSDFIKFTQHIDNFPGSEGRSDASGRFFDIVLKTNQNQGVVSVDIKNVKVTEQNKFASQGDTDRQFHVRKIDANSNIFDNYFYATGETLVGLNSAQSYSGLSTYTGSVGVYTRTFFWEPDLSVEISNDVSSRINNLKGSFNELLNISKNQNMVQSLDLEFSNRGRAETYAILHFLETHLGYKTFSYQHQDDLIKKNKIYYCPTWEHTFNYFNSNTIKARFVEVPTPITPNF